MCAYLGSTFEKFSLLPLSLVPDSFTEQLKECARKFADYQVCLIVKKAYFGDQVYIISFF